MPRQALARGRWLVHHRVRHFHGFDFLSGILATASHGQREPKYQVESGGVRGEDGVWHILADIMGDEFQA